MVSKSGGNRVVEFHGILRRPTKTAADQILTFVTNICFTTTMASITFLISKPKKGTKKQHAVNPGLDHFLAEFVFTLITLSSR